MNYTDQEMNEITKGQMANDERTLFSETGCDAEQMAEFDLVAHCKKRVANVMRNRKVGKRRAVGILLKNAESVLAMDEMYDMDCSESSKEVALYSEMLKALPLVQHVKNSIGNMFPELAKLKVA